MIVYVETNFLLEIAFEQEEEEACNAILDLVESTSNLELAVPAFCYSEALWALRGRRKQRNLLQDELKRELHEIGRTRSYREKAQGDLARILTESIQNAESRLEALRERLITNGYVLPLTHEVFQRAAGASEQFGLQEPDSVVLATVLIHRISGAEDACFLNRNVRDFDASVSAELSATGCKLIGSFRAGLAYIRHALQGLPSA